MSNEKLIFTPKQQELMSLLKHNRLHRLNLLEGSVRSGKTWISLILWAIWIADRPSEHLYMMTGKSLQTLKRNCLLPLQELVGINNFSFSLAAKEAVLFGHKIMLEGANDARSEQKIRGITLGGAYADELTLYPEDFFSMLLSRLSVAGAKFIGTTNPDKPTHWLKTKYMDNKEVDMLCIKFLIDDNTTLPQEYIRSIKKEYQGVFYERFIKGAWVSAEGCIYNVFADNPDRYIIEMPPNDIMVVTIGIDFGGNGSAHAAVATGITKGYKQVITLDEYYRKEIITPSELGRDLCNFIKGVKQKYRCGDAYLDSAETTLIAGIKAEVKRQHIGINIHNARKGSILNRIRLYQMLQGTDRYKIMRNCKHTIEAFSTAIWKPNTTEDIRLDDGSINIDNLDAQEYSTEPFMHNIIRNGG